MRRTVAVESSGRSRPLTLAEVEQMCADARAAGAGGGEPMSGRVTWRGRVRVLTVRIEDAPPARPGDTPMQVKVVGDGSADGAGDPVTG